MKDTANAALGFPGEIIQAPGMVRLRDPLIQRSNEKTILRILIPILFVALAVAVLMTASWSRGKHKTTTAIALPAVRSTLTGNVAGHEIDADIDATGYIVDRGNAPGVEFLGHKLVIEKDRVLLDGLERAKIPAQAKLNIVVADATLNVTANGVKTFHTTIKR